MSFKMTPTERRVRNALHVRRWRTTNEIVVVLGGWIDQFAVAQALYYLHRNGRAERQSTGEGSRWRRA